MATLTVEGADLVVGLSWLERIGSVHGNVRIPLRAVRVAAPAPDPWGDVRGIRLAGTGIPGVAAYGVRYSPGGGREFAAVHGRGPAVRVELDRGASRFATLLVTVPDVDKTAAAICAAAGI